MNRHPLLCTWVCRLSILWFAISLGLSAYLILRGPSWSFITAELSGLTVIAVAGDCYWPHSRDNVWRKRS